MATYDLSSKIASSRINPRALTKLGLEFMKVRSDGDIAIVEPSNPISLMIEYGAAVANGTLLAIENATRPLYKSATTTYRELYRHMADKDFLDRFSSPAKGSFILLLDMEEVLSKAVLVPGTNGMRKLVVPRNTSVVVEDHSFNLQYPIEIRVLPQDNISVNYDLSQLSPFDLIKSNRLQWRSSFVEGVRKLAISIDMKQLKLVTSYININELAGYRKELAFSDYFYYARAFTRGTNSLEWTEIKTVHTDDIYDPYTATAILRVLNGIVVVNIPQIYFANGLIKDELRIDVYTTKGPVSLDLGLLMSEDFTVKLMESTEPLDFYSAPLQTMRSFKILCPGKVTGGGKGLSFIELRDRVINRSYSQLGLPITELQLKQNARVEGFDVVKYVDNITSRTYVATKEIPPPANGDLVNGMDMTILPWITRITDEVDGVGVVRVGPRYIINPSVLFEETDSGLVRVEQRVVELYNDPSAYPPDILARAINSANYLYTPYHYVIDTSSDRMRLSAYSLTTPVVESTDFVQENLSLGVTTSSLYNAVGYNEDGTGYRIAVEMGIDGMPPGLGGNEIDAQLSFVIGQARRYFTGILKGPFDPDTNQPVSGRWIFLFEIPTQFDVDENNRMSLGNESSTLPLFTEFDLAYVIRDYAPTNSHATDIDKLVSPTLLSNYAVGSTYYGIVQEKLFVEFGRRLDRLWTRMRTIGGTQDYLKYTDDIPRYYEEDVYKLTEGGIPEVTIDLATNDVTFTKLHRAGEIQLDDNGRPIIEFARGTYILDQHGEKIPDNGIIGQRRELDLFLLDASYKYANDSSTVNYKNQTLDLLRQWIEQDLETLSGRLIDQTRLFYHPKKSFGQVRVITGVGDPEVIRSEQRLTVTYDVALATFNNLELRNAISERTGRVVDEVLKNTVISKTDAEIALKKAFEAEILGARIQGLFEDAHHVVTVTDRSIRPVIGKRLIVTGTKSLRVVNDIDCVFVPHKV